MVPDALPESDRSGFRQLDLPEQLDLALEQRSEPIQHPLPCLGHECERIAGRSAARVLDEVGVARRDEGATDPVALDLVAVRLMGFDERCLPKVHEPMRDTGLRVTQVRSTADVAVFESRASSFEGSLAGLEGVSCDRTFLPHAGWKGHVERDR